MGDPRISDYRNKRYSLCKSYFTIGNPKSDIKRQNAIPQDNDIYNKVAQITMCTCGLVWLRHLITSHAVVKF